MGQEGVIVLFQDIASILFQQSFALSGGTLPHHEIKVQFAACVIYCRGSWSPSMSESRRKVFLQASTSVL